MTVPFIKIMNYKIFIYIYIYIMARTIHIIRIILILCTINHGATASPFKQKD